MKKLFAILFIAVLLVGAANAANNVIGVKFRENATTQLQGKTADSFSNWTDSLPVGANGTGLVVLGSDSLVTVDWASSNTWRAGSDATADQAIYREYLDDGGSGVLITIGGLSNWLTSVGAGGYTVRLYQNTDWNTASFLTTNLTDGTNILASVTPTNMWADNGTRAFVDSGVLTAGTLVIDGAAGPSDGKRGCIAAFKITAIAPDNVENNSPANGAVNIPVSRTASGNDLVFTINNPGIVEVDVQFGLENDPSLTTNPAYKIVDRMSVTQGQYTINLESELSGNLEFATTYYWKVIGYEPNAISGQNDIIVSGSVSSFTTMQEPQACIPGDIDGDCFVGIQDLLLFADQWLNGSGSDADFVGHDGVNAADLAVMAQNWLTARSRVIINEIHCNPDLAQELVEFIELHNISVSPIDISGWQFTNGVTYTFPAGTTIAGGGYIVVTEDPNLAVTPVSVTSKYGTSANLVKGPFTGNLSNEGETITLSDALGNTVDKVDYQLGFPWPTVGDAVPDTSLGSGHSIQLVNPAFDNDLGGNWRSAYPTPGAVNTAIYAANLPPCIRQVDHSPKQPSANEAVTITAKVTDTDSVSSVILKYQINDPGNYIPITLPLSGTPPTQVNPDYENAANWTSLTMHDDGLNGDIESGDGVYTIQIPAATQIHRRLIRYRITAADNGSRSITVPYADDPQPNFAYFVYNGLPSWTGDGVTYTPEVLGSLPVYHLIARNSDVENLFWNQSWNDGQYHFVGTMVYDGEVYDHIYYHIRGIASTYRWGKNKCRFNFNRGHKFQARDDYGKKYDNKWDNLVLGTGTCPWWQFPHPGGSWDVGTGGMVLNEPLGYRLYNMAGVSSPNTNYFHFRVIDGAAESGATQYEGDFWGMYFAIENPDGRFLQEHGLADGNVYKMEVGYADKRNQSATQVTDGSDVNWFTSSSTGYNKTNPYQPQSWWETNVNLDWYYSFKTVGIVTNNSDPRPQENCFYYHDPVTNKWSIHPWDLDLNFEWATHYTDWEHIKYCLSYSDLNLAYQNRARELVDLLFDNTHYGWRQTDQLVDEMAAVVADNYNGQRFIDADQAMWDNHPQVNYKGFWYKNNEWFTQPGNSANWDFMVAYYKQYLTSTGMSGFLSGSYGLHSLNSSIADASIPGTPTITYIGTAGYPENDLRFQTNDYSGTNAFAAYQWRIARVDDPNAAGYIVRQRHNYEVETKWQSPDITDSAATTVRIPADQVEVEGTYRIRCRFKDNTGRCGHWSDPIQFVAGGGVMTDLLQNLRITELMYNPAEPSAAEIAAGYTDNDLFEFIELRNTGTTTLDLIDTFFSNGIEYSFGGLTEQTETPLISTGFDSSADGFTYADDTFGTTNSGLFATDTYEASGGQGGGGGVRVHLGQTGVTRSTAMSGGWSRSFTMAESNNVTIRVDYHLIISDRLDSDEFGEAIMTIDGIRYGSDTNSSLIHRAGNAVVGYNDDYGWLSYQTTIGLSAGMHTIIIGGYCNKYNSTNAEWADVYFDNVSITTMMTTEAPFTLAAGAYALIVKNQAAFETRYPGLTSLIAGQYTGSLSNSGETIRLTDAWDGNVFKFSYNDGYGWPVSADGPGHSLVPIDSAVAGEHDGSLEYCGNWRASTYIKGSPGVIDPTPPSSIMINEVMAHTDISGYDSNDWIELYNPTDASISYNSSWYLSDNPDNLKKWALPSSGSISSHGWASFDEINNFHTSTSSGFGLDKSGEYVILSYLPGNSTDRVVDYIRFGGQYNTVSWGRYPDGGNYWFFLANPGTRNTANANPVQHPVVISEIMYHPQEGTTKEEYIELYNPTGSAVNLYNAFGTWRLDNAVTYVFPASKSIPAGGKIVIVPFDPAVDTDQLAAFNTAYGCSLVAGTTIFGPWTGDLSNAAERLALQEPQEADPPSITTIWWITVDQVNYADCLPWVTSPDGTDTALVRKSPAASASGDNPTNWAAGTATPGY